MSEVDICERLRLAPTSLIGTVDEDTYRACHEAAKEIERLRLSEDEIDAIEHGLERLELHSDPDCEQSAATLVSLLERLAPERQ